MPQRTQLRSLEPPPFQPSSNEIATSAEVSPTSLLWAHQLRREHKALVSRIDKLEGRLDSATDSTGSKIESVRTHVNGLDERFNEIMGEIREIRGLLDAVNVWREAEERDRQARAKNKREMEVEWKDNLKAEIRDEISALERMISELRERALLERGGPLAFTLVARDYGTPPSAQPDQNTGRRNLDIEIPSTISGTPTIARQNTKERCISPSNSDPCSGVFVPSTVRRGEASPILGNAPPACEQPGGPPEPLKNESHTLLMGLTQDALSLQSYLQLGESVLAKFPRRRDESRVVEAFWEGLAEPNIKKSVEERLEKDGWTWKVIRESVNAMLPPHEMQKPEEQSGQEEVSRRRKKRRIIPLVWSIEGEDGDCQ
ncbi:hypothetical protein VTO42DRAFT_882 [Malbranchea cinnamomea]